MALFLDISIDDTLCLDDGTVITLERKSGTRARLRIDGPAHVELIRNGRSKAEAESENGRDS